jgi:type IV secretion system protein VirB4
VVAEGWRPLQDDTFRAQIQDWSSTPRKKEALLILDTQSVDDIANSPIGSKIVQESATQIYFANPKAEKEQYCGKFGLNEKEFHLIRSLNKATHFFLVKQGKNSVVARINLQGLDDQIAVLSARTATVKLLDTIRSEVGDNPNDWLPIFYQRVRSNKNE